MLHMVTLILPKAHRDTMEVLFVFLKWVASFAHLDTETGSKMDLQNLAMVICPSILYSRGRDAVRDESLVAIPVVANLLEHQDEFNCVPQDFLPILQDQEYFANSLDLPSKEFLKKCESYLRLKASGRTSLVTSPVSGPANPGTPRPEDMRSMPPRSVSGGATFDIKLTLPLRPQTNPQYQDRPPVANALPSDNQIRNGQPQQRQPSAPALQHSPFSYPLPSGAPPQPTSQAMTPIHAPQPQRPPQKEEEWSSPERQPYTGQVPSRPASMANPYSARNSSEGAHPFLPNGRPQPAVRQRI